MGPKLLSAPFRPWLLSNVLLLAGLAVWGSVRYPHLPDRIPKHIGAEGVDAWTDRSVGSAFVLVFVHVGVTVLMAACGELTLRVTPREELSSAHAPPFAAGMSSALLNRPGSRASARRIARAVLVLNLCVGVSFAVGCRVIWRSTPDPEVSGWLLPVMILPIVVGTGLVIAAAVGDRKP